MQGVTIDYFSSSDTYRCVSFERLTTIYKSIIYRYPNNNNDIIRILNYSILLMLSTNASNFQRSKNIFRVPLLFFHK
jgi:hypothetical protein